MLHSKEKGEHIHIKYSKLQIQENYSNEERYQYYMTVRGSTNQKDIIILNENRSSKYMQQEVID